jgi:hypothetical protein
MGLFAAKMMKLSWLATFGDVLAEGGEVGMQEKLPKARFVLIAGFGLALTALIAVCTVAATSISHSP